MSSFLCCTSSLHFLPLLLAQSAVMQSTWLGCFCLNTKCTKREMHYTLALRDPTQNSVHLYIYTHGHDGGTHNYCYLQYRHIHGHNSGTWLLFIQTTNLASSLLCCISSLHFLPLLLAWSVALNPIYRESISISIISPFPMMYCEGIGCSGRLNGVSLVIFSLWWNYGGIHPFPRQ